MLGAPHLFNLLELPHSLSLPYPNSTFSLPSVTSTLPKYLNCDTSFTTPSLTDHHLWSLLHWHIPLLPVLVNGQDLSLVYLDAQLRLAATLSITCSITTSSSLLGLSKTISSAYSRTDNSSKLPPQHKFRNSCIGQLLLLLCWCPSPLKLSDCPNESTTSNDRPSRLASSQEYSKASIVPWVNHAAMPIGKDHSLERQKEKERSAKY